mmetsp:Transcript_17606/g.17681  ORF Transcript_17606/g.17681 Transcript_17606/m.17681 type:complete len:476 (-) Transcript_17606:409-1836(-)
MPPIPSSSLPNEAFCVHEILMTSPSLAECVRFASVRGIDRQGKDDDVDCYLATPLYTWINSSEEGLKPFKIDINSSESKVDKSDDHTFASTNSLFNDEDALQTLDIAAKTVPDRPMSPELKEMVALTNNHDLTSHIHAALADKMRHHEVQKRAVTAPASKGMLRPAKLSEFQKELKKNPFVFDSLQPEERANALKKATDKWQSVRDQERDLVDHERVLHYLPKTMTSAIAVINRPSNNPPGANTDNIAKNNSHKADEKEEKEEEERRKKHNQQQEQEEIFRATWNTSSQTSHSADHVEAGNIDVDFDLNQDVAGESRSSRNHSSKSLNGTYTPQKTSFLSTDQIIRSQVPRSETEQQILKLAVGPMILTRLTSSESDKEAVAKLGKTIQNTKSSKHLKLLSTLSSLSSSGAVYSQSQHIPAASRRNTSQNTQDKQHIPAKAAAGANHCNSLTVKLGVLSDMLEAGDGRADYISTS